MSEPKKNGLPVLQEYQSEAAVSKFGPIREYLRTAAPKYVPEHVSAADLARCVYDLRRHQEILCGKRPGGSCIPKFPVKVFNDYMPGGALCVVLKAAYKFRRNNGANFEYSDESVDNSLLVEMFQKAEKNLKANNFLEWPRVYISLGIDEPERTYLINIVKSHRGTVVSSKGQCTHAVYGIEKDENEDEDWMRPVVQNEDGTKIKVHWWYMPDSYDEWTPASEVDEKPASRPPAPAILNVSRKFLQYTEKFNEWMNEEDYELSAEEVVRVEALEKEFVAKEEEKAALKRQRSASSTRSNTPEPPVKKQRTEPKAKIVEGVVEPDPSGAIPGVAPVPVVNTVAKEVDESGKSKNLDMQPLRLGLIMNISQTEEGKDNFKTAEEKKREQQKEREEKVDVESTEKKDDDKYISQGEGEAVYKVKPVNPEVKEEEDGEKMVAQAAQQFEIIIPSFSAWFNYNSVHAIEKRALPEFFNGKNRSKTPEIYLAYRNFLVDTYRLNPNQYLTATACRRNLVGDVCSIIRLHAFLEQWGLINYQVSPDCTPSGMGPPQTNHFTVMTDTPRGLYPLIPANTKTPTPQSLIDLEKVDAEKALAKSASKPQAGLNYGLRKDLYAGSQASSKCKSCDTILSGPFYKHSTEHSFTVCCECFAEGKYPSGMNSNQFSKEVASSKVLNSWSDQETLLLLEGLEMYKDDWNRVSDHVGTKTQDECILHFLQLPIEDPYLEANMESLGPLKHQPIPFSNSSNPLLSTVAFLASVVDPAVAAAGAKAAMAHFDELSKEGENELEGDKKNLTGKENIQTAAAAALGASAVKANVLASVEEKRLQGLVAQIVEAQLRKIQLKLTHFEQLEELLEKEKEALEKQRQDLISERLEFYAEKAVFENQKETPIDSMDEGTGHPLH
eukprot:Nk52_evm25s252 gene=Nk52_evmTU25s252